MSRSGSTNASAAGFVYPAGEQSNNHVEPVWNPQGFVTARESVTVTQVLLNKRTATRNAENADNF